MPERSDTPQDRAAHSGPRPIPAWPWLFPALSVYVIFALALAPAILAVILIAGMFVVLGVIRHHDLKDMHYEDFRDGPLSLRWFLYRNRLP